MPTVLKYTEIWWKLLSRNFAFSVFFTSPFSVLHMAKQPFCSPLKKLLKVTAI